MSSIFLDHNATSPLLPEARAAMLAVLDAAPANASSVHRPGHDARLAIEAARARVAALVGAAPDEIVFTSGGTEANNLALHGATTAAAGARLVVSAIEHPSVLRVAEALERGGATVVRVRPGRDGVVPAASVLEAAAPGTTLVSLMLANNEVGTLQPVAEIGAALGRRGVLFHCDAAQAAGKVPIDVAALHVDLLSVAAHKCGGPQGAGALFVRRGLVLAPHLQGGGQERNRRPGTENVAAIAGFGAAAATARRELAASARRAGALRDGLEARLIAAVPGLRVHGSEAERVPNTSSLGLVDIEGETLVIALDLEGFAVSAGSACSAGTIRRSHVLEAMGLGVAASNAVRVSLGPATTAGEIDAFVSAFVRVVGRARRAAAPPPAAGAPA